MKESLRVLKECADIQAKKGEDYQNPNSRVKQAQYYPNGCRTIHDIMHGKMLRMQSVMEAMENDDYAANFESLEDSAIDLINYASFFVSYLRGGIEGQTANHDFLNRIKPTKHDRPEPKDEGSVGSVVTVGLVPRATGSTPSEEFLMRNKREPKI